jgi:hypothetical protein
VLFSLKQTEEKMSNIGDDPSYWLGRAKEMREMLKSVSDEEMREIIEEIAEGYERIAEGIVRKQNGPIKH